jgi:hypothetical protein
VSSGETDAGELHAKHSNYWLLLGKTGTGMSRKPEKTTGEDKKKRRRKRKTEQTITRCAVSALVQIPSKGRRG